MLTARCLLLAGEFTWVRKGWEGFLFLEFPFISASVRFTCFQCRKIASNKLPYTLWRRGSIGKETLRWVSPHADCGAAGIGRRE